MHNQSPTRLGDPGAQPKRQAEIITQVEASEEYTKRIRERALHLRERLQGVLSPQPATDQQQPATVAPPASAPTCTGLGTRIGGNTQTLAEVEGILVGLLEALEL